MKLGFYLKDLLGFIRTRRARQPAFGRLARRWPKATGVGAAAFSKMLDVFLSYIQPEFDTPPHLAENPTFCRHTLDVVFADAI